MMCDKTSGIIVIYCSYQKSNVHQQSQQGHKRGSQQGKHAIAATYPLQSSHPGCPVKRCGLDSSAEKRGTKISLIWSRQNRKAYLDD